VHTKICSGDIAAMDLRLLVLLAWFLGRKVQVVG